MVYQLSERNALIVFMANIFTVVRKQGQYGRI